VDRRRPNVVFMTAHDIGRHLGCYGVPETGTDALDRLAAGGVRLSRFYGASPQCSPARASLMTGLFPHTHGVIGIASHAFGFDLHPGVTHLSSYLARAGYVTALAGLQHETLRPADLPFDHVLAHHAAGVDVAASAASYLRDRAGPTTRHQPFYLQIGFREAHRPWHGTQPYADRGVNVPPWLADEPAARQDLARFQGAIRALDRAAGEILDTLQQTGLAENTLVVFAADHGIPYPRAKHSLYEPGCACALLIRWPAAGWSRGQTHDALLSGVDLLPTLLDATGIPAPTGLHGASFRPLLDGRSYTARTYLFTEQNFNAYPDVSRAIRDHRHKLIANFTPGRSFYDSTQLWHPPARVSFMADQPRTQHPPVELYDLAADPLEQHDLAAGPVHAATLTALASRLHAWMQDTADPLLQGIPEPPIYRRALDRLVLASRPLHRETESTP